MWDQCADIKMSRSFNLLKSLEKKRENQQVRFPPGFVGSDDPLKCESVFEL